MGYQQRQLPDSSDASRREINDEWRRAANGVWPDLSEEETERIHATPSPGSLRTVPPASPGYGQRAPTSRGLAPRPAEIHLNHTGGTNRQGIERWEPDLTPLPIPAPPLFPSPPTKERPTPLLLPYNMRGNIIPPYRGIKQLIEIETPRAPLAVMDCEAGCKARIPASHMFIVHQTVAGREGQISHAYFACCNTCAHRIMDHLSRLVLQQQLRIEPPRLYYVQCEAMGPHHGLPVCPNVGYAADFYMVKRTLFRGSTGKDHTITLACSPECANEIRLLMEDGW